MKHLKSFEVKESLEIKKGDYVYTYTNVVDIDGGDIFSKFINNHIGIYQKVKYESDNDRHEIKYKISNDKKLNELLIRYNLINKGQKYFNFTVLSDEIMYHNSNLIDVINYMRMYIETKKFNI